MNFWADVVESCPGDQVALVELRADGSRREWTFAEVVDRSAALSSELAARGVGRGDVVLTIPYEWQLLFNASDVPVIERIDDPVPGAALETLLEKFPDFRRAYEPDGLSLAEFDTFGPTVRTLRTFIASYRDLTAVIRDAMLPDPDVK